MTLYRLEGKEPSLPEDGSHWIAPTADVIGNIHVGQDVIILFGAVLRGDNEAIVIGKGSNVQDLSMLHTDPGYPLEIGENCTIGHQAMLHGCKIGDNSLIGMGATVLNGAVIGKNCLIGAGAMVTENKTIPDGSMVLGVPGKIVKELDEATIAAMQGPAKSYQAIKSRYQGKLEVISN